MTLNYQKVWDTMNDLEMVTGKIVSAREILDSAVDRLAEHQYDKVETLLYAADEFLQYYLAEFDTKFKDAWEETVIEVRQKEIDDRIFAWQQSASEALSQQKEDKVVKWQLPIERKIEDGVDDYYIQFPDDLLEAINLKCGDEVEWVDQNDGSFLLRKVQ